MTGTGAVFAATKFAAATKAKAQTKRQKRIDQRRQKLDKIHADLNEAKGVVRKCVLGALSKREKLLISLEGTINLITY